MYCMHADVYYYAQERTSQEPLEDVVQRKLQGTCFSRAFLNPQGQLCLDLNRPIMFQKTLSEVSNGGTSYGTGTSSLHHHGVAVSLLHCPCSIRIASNPSRKSSLTGLEGVVCGCHEKPEETVCLEEVRIYLLAGAVANVLRGCGCSVYRDVSCEVGMCHETTSIWMGGVGGWGR